MQKCDSRSQHMHVAKQHRRNETRRRRKQQLGGSCEANEKASPVAKKLGVSSLGISSRWYTDMGALEMVMHVRDQTPIAAPGA